MTPQDLTIELAKRSKRWSFTINNYDTNAMESLGQMFPEMVKYLVVGRETAPTTGTPHLQGYLELVKKKVGRSLLKKMPKGTCLIASKGSAQENTAYCAKGGDSQVWGTYAVQGERKDLQEMRQLILSGATDLTLADANFGSWLRYHAGFDRYRVLTQRTIRDWQPEIHIYWGTTGAGKTRKIIDKHKPEDVWIWNGNHKFYQGYNMQPVCVFDDFYGEITLSFMLKLTDRYPMIVNVKNGECNWQPKIIYFTSNVDPRLWEGWSDKPQAVRDAFFRRVREKGSIVHFEGIYCGLRTTVSRNEDVLMYDGTLDN